MESEGVEELRLACWLIVTLKPTQKGRIAVNRLGGRALAPGQRKGIACAAFPAGVSYGGSPTEWRETVEIDVFDISVCGVDTLQLE
jgi:hypothetical protein